MYKCASKFILNVQQYSGSSFHIARSWIVKRAVVDETSQRRTPSILMAASAKAFAAEATTTASANALGNLSSFVGVITPDPRWGTTANAAPFNAILRSAPYTWLKVCSFRLHTAGNFKGLCSNRNRIRVNENRRSSDRSKHYGECEAHEFCESCSGHCGSRVVVVRGKKS